MVGEIAEAKLQRWFEEKARQRVIGEYIINSNTMETTPKWRRKGMHESKRMQMDGLDKARKVYETLENANYLSGNRSISDVGYTQLRPDLVMISPDAHYLLVELKTRKGTERQGVQELLAYSAAIKMQLPFINEFMYIIVASHWDTLLAFSVRSLIIDGKHVLPLALEFAHNGEFQLRIQHTLFDMEVSEPYDPFYAMVPHTLATTVYKASPLDGEGNKRWLHARAKRDVENYFRHMAYHIAAECRRVKQSGFVMVWNDMSSRSSTCISLTVVTVNQFWKYSEHLGNDAELGSDTPAAGITRVKQSVVQALREEIFSRPAPADGVFDELDNIFRSAEAWQAVETIHPQSSLSYDLICRHANPDEEERIKESDNIQMFETGGTNNLGTLLKEMQQCRLEKIFILSTFGDVSDFFQDRSRLPLLIHIDFATLQKIMADFRASKLKEN